MTRVPILGGELWWTRLHRLPLLSRSHAPALERMSSQRVPLLQGLHNWIQCMVEEVRCCSTWSPLEP